MKRIVPVVPTIIVVFAVLMMVRLGLWQLARAHEKRALVAEVAANPARPLAPFAALWPVREADLFRRTAVSCLGPGEWRAIAGRDVAGGSGVRHIAGCRTGAEGPGVLVDLGVSQSPDAPAWAGGRVSGRLTWAPDDQPLVARLFRAAPAPTPLIVAEQPAPGLKPSAQPDPATIPNNHLSYAVQWFLFAVVALAVYGVLLWRRARSTPPPGPA